MKRLLLIPFFIICAHIVVANPIAPPPAISELELFENDFFLELVYLEYYNIENLDNCRLKTTNDSALFITGIVFNQNDILIINQTHLETPLTINPEADYILFQEYYDGNWITWGSIYFGNHNYSYITIQLDGESIIRQEFYYWSQKEHFYWIVKNKPPSPGNSVFHTDSRGSFSGYVFDKYLQPVPHAFVKYCPEEYNFNGTEPPLYPIYTDTSGYFIYEDMFARKYDIQIIFEDSVILDSSIAIELDSNNYYEFVLNNFAVGLSDQIMINEIELTNHPNPFTQSTNFNVSIPDNYNWKEAKITILDMSGRAVDQIYQYNTGFNHQFSIQWNSPEVNAEIKPGIYIYVLEIDNKQISSNKMIFVK